MRPHLIVLIGLCSLLPIAADAQTDQVPFRLIPVYAGAPIVIDGAALGGRQSTGMLQATLRFQAGLVCMNVHNTDARTASAVRYASAYYDATGKRVGDENFTRKASFTTGTPMLGFDRTTGLVRENGCLPIHYPREGIGADIVFVDHVDFADGTEWNAADVHLPDDVGTAFTPRARAPVPRAAAGNVVELAPVVAGSFSTCSTAQNAISVVTPTFQGSLPMSYDDDRSVVLEATTDRIDVSGFHVASTTVCKPSNDAARTAAAQALLAGAVIPLAGRVVRVYFPYINTTSRCTAPARVMIGQQALPAGPRKLDLTAGAGVYVATVAIPTDSGGTAHDPVLKISSGRPELDDAALKAAAANRYWPAIRDGNPVAGEAAVSFGWEYDAPMTRADGKISVSSRAFVAETPPAPDC